MPRDRSFPKTISQSASTWSKSPVRVGNGGSSVKVGIGGPSVKVGGGGLPDHGNLPEPSSAGEEPLGVIANENLQLVRDEMYKKLKETYGGAYNFSLTDNFMLEVDGTGKYATKKLRYVVGNNQNNTPEPKIFNGKDFDNWVHLKFGTDLQNPNPDLYEVEGKVLYCGDKFPVNGTKNVVQFITTEEFDKLNRTQSNAENQEESLPSSITDEIAKQVLSLITSSGIGEDQDKLSTSFMVAAAALDVYAPIKPLDALKNILKTTATNYLEVPLTQIPGMEDMEHKMLTVKYGTDHEGFQKKFFPQVFQAVPEIEVGASEPFAKATNNFGEPLYRLGIYGSRTPLGIDYFMPSEEGDQIVFDETLLPPGLKFTGLFHEDCTLLVLRTGTEMQYKAHWGITPANEQYIARLDFVFAPPE